MNNTQGFDLLTGDLPSAVLFTGLTIILVRAIRKHHFDHLSDRWQMRIHWFATLCVAGSVIGWIVLIVLAAIGG